MAVAAADSGSEDLYTESDNIGRARASTVSLSLSDKARTQRESVRASMDSPVRDSVESNSTAGLLRLSLPNGGWGRRSIESFDDEEVGDYSYNKSGTRGYDDDSAPMMASLSLPKGGQMLDSSLTSAVDIRASQSLLLSPGSAEVSGIDDIKKSKFNQFVESVNASKTAKKIPFGDDDDDDEIEVVESGGAKSLRDREKIAEEKSSTNHGRKDSKDSKGSPAKEKTYSDVQGFSTYDSDEDEDGDGSLTFDLSHGSKLPLHGSSANVGAGARAGGGLGGSGRVKESIDFGDTGKTVSTLGGSGSVNLPLHGRLKDTAEGKGSSNRFDLDRTVDSEGEMLRGRNAPMSQVSSAPVSARVSFVEYQKAHL